MITFTGLICLTYLFINAEPIEWVKKFFLVDQTARTNKQWHMGLITLFNCSLCSGFWIGLIYYQDIMMAALVSLASEIFAIGMKKIGNTL